MAAPQAPPEPLSPELGGRLAEFAQGLQGGDAHRVDVSRDTSGDSGGARPHCRGRQAGDAYGSFAITVLPDALLIDGRGFAKPEPSVVELAALLHQQLIGELTLLDRLDDDGWHAFLSLLAKSPGRRARRWAAWPRPGRPPATRRSRSSEIDYAEVLRERAGAGESATWDRILDRPEGRRRGATAARAPTSMQNMMALADDPERLAQFAQRLQDVGKASGDDSLQQRKSLLELMHGLANYAAERKPEELDTVLDQDGRRRGADVAGHAAHADHRSAADAGRRRRAAHGPGRRAAVAPHRRDGQQVPGRQRRQGSRRQQSPGHGVPYPGARSVEAAGHPRRGGRAGEGDVPRRSAIRERLDELDARC